MNKGPLSTQSIDFAIDVVNYYKWLVSDKKEYVMSKQLLKSGTSVGANIHEADFAVSKADFISKMQIALKELAETEYWLIVLERTGYLPAEQCFLKEKCMSIKRMLIASLNTSKSN
ncbi:MAG: four helix bundle protein [Clostridia bacterium]|nr:four helix bundle protein [Clostridia bacterium]